MAKTPKTTRQHQIVPAGQRITIPSGPHKGRVLIGPCVVEQIERGTDIRLNEYSIAQWERLEKRRTPQ